MAPSASVTITTATVRCTVSWRVGQLTFLSSLMMSSANRGRHDSTPPGTARPSRRGAARPGPGRLTGRAGEAARFPVLGSFTDWRLTARFMLLSPLALSDFPVRPVAAAAATELPQLYPVRVAAPVLLRRVVPVPAFGAGQVNDHPVFLLCHSTPVPWSAPRRT